MRKGIGLSLLAFLAAALLTAASPPPVLRMPGSPERKITPESLLGADRQDVRREDSAGGGVTVFHGSALLDVLEGNGLDAKTMAAGRKLAPAVVIATARDGYTVVFSVGELLMHRADPRVFLVAETAGGPLPENEGPVRLIVYGDGPRSPYGLASIELKVLADNVPARPH